MWPYASSLYDNHKECFIQINFQLILICISQRLILKLINHLFPICRFLIFMFMGLNKFLASVVDFRVHGNLTKSVPIIVLIDYILE